MVIASTVASPPVSSIVVSRRWIGSTLGVGLLAAVTLIITDFTQIDLSPFGLGSIAERDLRLVTARRLSVYLPAAIGLLAGVPVGRVLLRTPMVFFTAFVAWATVSSLFAENWFDEVERMTWFASFVLLVAMAVVHLGWRRVLELLAGLAVAFVGAGLLFHAIGWVGGDTFAFGETQFFGFARVKGLALGANGFGSVAALLTLMAATLARYEVRLPHRLAWGACAAVGVVGAAASQSRFALAALTLGALTLLASQSRRWRFAGGLGVVVLAAIAGVVALSGSADSFTRTGDGGELSTLLGRTDVWAQAIETATNNPVTGVGIEALSADYAAAMDAGYLNWDPTNAHNVVLQAAASHGIVAGVLVLMALLVGLVGVWRSGQPGAPALVVAFALAGVGEALLIGSPSFVVAALVGALVAAAIAPDGDSNSTLA